MLTIRSELCLSQIAGECVVDLVDHVERMSFSFITSLGHKSWKGQMVTTTFNGMSFHVHELLTLPLLA